MGQSDDIAERTLGVREAIIERRSVRRFLPDAVPDEIVRTILSEAARAPSGANIQPWQVHVVTGVAKDRVSRAVLDAAAEGRETPEYAYYPDEFFEPYLGRRRKVGYDLYGLLGIAKGDKPMMRAQHDRNFVFFDAPVGLFVTIDRRFNLGSYMDAGMFIQNILLLARAWGYETCPQAAWVRHGGTVRGVLAIPESHILLCGIALGRIDVDAPENRLQTERAAAETFTTFHSD